MERFEAAESGITTEGDLQRTRRQTVSKLYQQQFFIFQYYSPHTGTESARAREWAREGGFEGATSDSLHVCTVSASTLPIYMYRDDEFRGHFDVPIPIEIHRLLPEIPVNGGPVPTMMRLPAIHDQV